MGSRAETQFARSCLSVCQYFPSLVYAYDDSSGIFASGNERTPIRTNGKFKYGIEFGTGDSLGMLYDLMNESKQAATYYIEMVCTQEKPTLTP